MAADAQQASSQGLVVARTLQRLPDLFAFPLGQALGQARPALLCVSFLCPEVLTLAERQQEVGILVGVPVVTEFGG